MNEFQQFEFKKELFVSTKFNFVQIDIGFQTGNDYFDVYHYLGLVAALLSL